ncbi:MAG: hypothetical protein LUC18_02885 [Porphyromonadaceae bacterium]|nr:hypothetical protein [Porphyromonadaceae bacterium]
MEQAILILLYKKPLDAVKLIGYFEGKCDIFVHVDKDYISCSHSPNPDTDHNTFHRVQWIFLMEPDGGGEGLRRAESVGRGAQAGKGIYVALYIKYWRAGSFP